MEHNSIGYPTQGDLIKFAYDAFGLLPTKRTSKYGIDETAKKSIQTKLTRLANEDGNLEKNAQILVKQLSDLCVQHLNDEKISSMISEIIFDLFEVHSAFIRNDPTFLTKKDTLKKLINPTLVSRLAFSISKHAIRFNLVSDNLSFPNLNAFLPTVENAKINSPLSNVLNWTYKLLNLSSKNFHCPDLNNSLTAFKQEQHFESAKKWLQSKHQPSANDLLHNINYSLDQIECSSNINIRRKIDSDTRKSIVLALFFARLSTEIFNRLNKAYGINFIVEVCQQFQNYWKYVSEETAHLKLSTFQYSNSGKYPKSETDTIIYYLIDEYFKNYRYVMFERASELLSDQLFNPDELIPESPEFNALVNKYGRLVVMLTLDNLPDDSERFLPVNLLDKLNNGLALKDSPLTTFAQIEEFETKLHEDECNSYFPWLVYWIRGNFFLRNSEVNNAFESFQRSLESAKYCAGRFQLELVEQYIKLAAKLDNWKEFKKTVDWAIYLELPIPWLKVEQASDTYLRNHFFKFKLS